MFVGEVQTIVGTEVGIESMLVKQLKCLLVPIYGDEVEKVFGTEVGIDVGETVEMFCCIW
jgi:hypothetical protein